MAKPPERRKGSRRTESQVQKIKLAMAKVKGVDRRELEKIMRPIGRAHNTHVRSVRILERQFETMYRYMNHRLNKMHIDGYPEDEINRITEILQQAHRSFYEELRHGFESYLSHLSDASEALENLIELGPHEPYK